MRKILMTILICAMFITGCSNSSAYNSYMEQGKSAIVEKEYDKSLEYFALAMEEKKDDKESKSLYEQVSYLVKAIKFEEEGKLEEAILNYEKISTLESESDVVKKISEELKKKCDEEIKALKERIKEIDEQITEAKNMIKENTYSKAKKTLEQILEKCEKDKRLNNRVAEIKELINKCDEKIKESESVNSQNKASTLQADNSNKVYCDSCGKYVKAENYEGEVFNKCNGCIIARDLGSSSMSTDCGNCGSSGTVHRMNGICNSCNVKVSPAVSEIREDGTVIFDDGTRW